MGFAADDIKVLIDMFGKEVTFISAGYVFSVKGIFAEIEETATPLDGDKPQRRRTLTCDYEQVKDLTVLYTVLVGNIEYPILAIPKPINGMTEILLGRP
jgi:hypothetical protein